MRAKLTVVLALLSSAVWIPAAAPPAAAATSNDPTCATPVTGTPAGTSGPSATAPVLNVGGANELATVWDPPANNQGAFPSAASHDVVAADGTPRKQVTVAFSEGRDVASENTPPGQVVSTNGSASFDASTYGHIPGVSYTRLRNGTLIGYAFKPTAVTADGLAMTFPVYRSTDDGATWTTGSATVGVGAGTLAGRTPDGAGRMHRHPIELPDGTILVSYYGTFNQDTSGGRTGHRSAVAASTDGGTTFTHRGVIARDTTAANSYPEAAIEQLPDGRVLSVVRHHTWSGSAWDLATPRQTVSADGGATWSAPQDVAVSFPNGYDYYDDNNRKLLGVAPSLTRMPNGIMVLGSGRPDNWIAMSTNGSGTGWVGGLTYRNCPTTGYRLHGSTGNADLAVIESNRIAQFGDNCELTWACPAADTGFTIDKQNRVWRRYVDVLTPDVGKIDLATKYRLGQVSVDTNLTWTSPARPRSRVDGAFDGSTEYWSSAVGSGGGGSYVLRLDRQYTLTRVGLSLRNGRAATGRVYASTDGVTWGSPIVDATNRTHLSLEYFGVAAAARFVKVEVDASANCDAELGASCALLNEIELYSTVNSFENDPVNNRPRGFTELSQTWVTRSGVNGSSRALRLSDSSDDEPARVVWTAPTAGTARTFDFRVNPVALPNGFLFDVRGKNSAGSIVDSYHFAVFPDGSIRRYNGTWVAITGAGVVPVGGWRTVTVRASTTTATIVVDGQAVATAIPPSNASTSLIGYTFSSGGKPPVGDQVVVDDVSFS
jgi:hypothetical protein